MIGRRKIRHSKLLICIFHLKDISFPFLFEKRRSKVNRRGDKIKTKEVCLVCIFSAVALIFNLCKYTCSSHFELILNHCSIIGFCFNIWFYFVSFAWIADQTNSNYGTINIRNGSVRDRLKWTTYFMNILSELILISPHPLTFVVSKRGARGLELNQISAFRLNLT